jgi:hypothetical protein
MIHSIPFVTIAQEYANWIAVAFFSGIFNVIASWLVLLEDSKRSPVFRPFRYPPFWLWIVAEFLVPIAGFWYLFSINEKPPVDINLFVKSIVFGISFPTLVNSSATTIGSKSFSVKVIYDVVIRKVRDAVFSKDIHLNSAFWTDFELELTANTNADIAAAVLYIENCIKLNDKLPNKLSEEDLKKITAKIKKIKAQTHPDNCKDTVDLIKEIMQGYFILDRGAG